MLWKLVWQFLIKLGINLPQDPAIPVLGIYPKDTQPYHNDTCSTMFIALLCSSTEEWIKKMWYIYMMEYNSAIKNNDIAGKWVELEKNHPE